MSLKDRFMSDIIQQILVTIQILIARRQQCVLVRMPGHCSIPGNEAVDVAAKHAVWDEETGGSLI